MAKGDIKKLYEENKNDIIQKFLSGLTIKEIANEYNFNYSTLKAMLHNDNIYKPNKINRNDEIDIVEKYNSGLNILDLTKIYHVGTKKISDILKSYNIKYRMNHNDKQDDFDINNYHYKNGFNPYGNRGNNRKYEININYFDTIDSPNKAYILGFIYADGHCCFDEIKHRYYLRICLKEDDKQILDNIKNELEYTGDIYHIDLSKRRANGVNASDQECLNINNKYIAQSLNKLGVINNKTYFLKFPNFLQEDLFQHFIRGLSDGDGCIVSTVSMWSYTGTYELLLGIKNIVEKKLNIHMSLIKQKKEHENIYRLQISGGKQVKKFLDYIYKDADLKLNRKYELYLNKYCKAA